MQLFAGAWELGIEFVHDDLQASAGILGDFLELGESAVASAADAAFWVSPGGERVARAAGDLLVYDGAHQFFVDGGAWNSARGARNSFDSRRAMGRLGGILGHGGACAEQQYEKACRDKHQFTNTDCSLVSSKFSSDEHEFDRLSPMIYPRSARVFYGFEMPRCNDK